MANAPSYTGRYSVEFTPEPGSDARDLNDAATAYPKGSDYAAFVGHTPDQDHQSDRMAASGSGAGTDQSATSHRLEEYQDFASGFRNSHSANQAGREYAAAAADDINARLAEKGLNLATISDLDDKRPANIPGLSFRESERAKAIDAAMSAFRDFSRYDSYTQVSQAATGIADAIFSRHQSTYQELEATTAYAPLPPAQNHRPTVTGGETLMMDKYHAQLSSAFKHDALGDASRDEAVAQAAAAIKDLERYLRYVGLEPHRGISPATQHISARHATPERMADLPAAASFTSAQHPASQERGLSTSAAEDQVQERGASHTGDDPRFSAFEAHHELHISILREAVAYQDASFNDPHSHRSFIQQSFQNLAFRSEDPTILETLADAVANDYANRFTTAFLASSFDTIEFVTQEYQAVIDQVTATTFQPLPPGAGTEQNLDYLVNRLRAAESDPSFRAALDRMDNPPMRHIVNEMATQAVLFWDDSDAARDPESAARQITAIHSILTSSDAARDSWMQLFAGIKPNPDDQQPTYPQASPSSGFDSAAGHQTTLSHLEIEAISDAFAARVERAHELAFGTAPDTGFSGQISAIIQQLEGAPEYRTAELYLRQGVLSNDRQDPASRSYRRDMFNQLEEILSTAPATADAWNDFRWGAMMQEPPQPVRN